FFFSSRRRHTRWPRDWSSDVCSSDLAAVRTAANLAAEIEQIAGTDSLGVERQRPGRLLVLGVLDRFVLRLLDRLVFLEFRLRHRSEEHTSELESRGHLVCRLLLEKKK